MPKNSPLPFTKDDLKKELSKFATKKDLDLQYEKIKSTFASKDDLKKELSGFATKDDLKRYATKDDLDNFSFKMEDHFKNFRSDMYNLIDTVLKEIINVRENQEAHTFAHSRVDDDLADHDTRIKKLEHISIPS